MLRPIAESEIAKALERSGVPLRYRSASLLHFESGYSVRWGRGGCFLTGAPGVGKTHLAAALLRDRLRAGHQHSLLSVRDLGDGEEYFIPLHSAVWVSVPQLLMEVRSTYRQKAVETEADVIRRYRRPKLLVLDDFAAEKVTDWSLSSVYLILSMRINEMRDTIVTSNSTLEDIAQWDTRIASRLAGLQQIVMRGADRRIGGNG